MEAFEPPDFSETSTDDLCGMMLACGASEDESDKMFAKACRDEIAKRKPGKTANVLADRREPIGEASSPKGDGRAAG